MEALQTAYDDAKTAAEEALNSTISAWGEMDNTAVTSAADVLTALQSQVEWLNNYQANLDALESRKIPGVDTSELVQSLSDGSAESAAILAGLATASDDEVAAIVANFGKVEQGKETLSGTMAEIKMDFDAGMDALKKSAAQAVEDMNLSAEAGNSSRDTMNGYILEAEALIPSLKATFAKAGRAANQAYRDAQESKSPSKKARQATRDYFDGLVLQADEMLPSLKESFSGAARAANDAVNTSLRASMNGMATELNYSPVINNASSNTMEVIHSGTVRFEGVNNKGEFVAAENLTMDRLFSEVKQQRRLL
jgi:hypothetical protein